MNTRRILLVFVCGCCLTGCKSGRQNQELLERELRFQEDRIYELENALDECEYELECSRRDTPSSGGQSSGGGNRRSGGSSGLPIIDMSPDSGSGAPRPRVPGDNDQPVMPTVEPGEEIAPPTTGGAMNMNTPEPRDRQIARIVLNKQLTGGATHVQGSEDGIVVVFEPRNVRGEMVGEPGDVSIALVDPQRSGPGARLARWDFAAKDAFEQFHRSGPTGRGYAFELPWPEAAPQNKELQLFVRYVTPDGRKLISQMMVNVDPPQTAGRWRTASPAANQDQPQQAAAGGRRRGLLSRFGSDSTPRDRGSEAPAFNGESAAGANETATLPKIERDEDEDRDEDDDPATARGLSRDRHSTRPVWTPYR